MPWLSVIMPTYNGATYIRSALASVAAQCDPDIEVILVDDGSTDLTLDIAREFSEKIQLFIYEKQRTGNWLTSTNFGLSAASGKFVSFLHQDDLWCEGRLARLKALTERSPEISAVVHSAFFVDTKGHRIGRWNCPFPPYPALISPDQVLARLLVQNFIALPAPIFLRDHAISVGLMDESLWYTGDWDFWLKILPRGNTVYIRETLCSFRVHPASQTVTRSMDADSFKDQMTIVLDRHIGGYKGSAKDIAKFSRLCHTSIFINTLLSAALHKGKPFANGLIILGLLARLGPLGISSYIRYSRIVERTSARVRAGLVRAGSL
jgi:glycosyltransferase involved in cell wall biosynthesis